MGGDLSRPWVGPQGEPIIWPDRLPKNAFREIKRIICFGMPIMSPEYRLADNSNCIDTPPHVLLAYFCREIAKVTDDPVLRNWPEVYLACTTESDKQQCYLLNEVIWWSAESKIKFSSIEMPLALQWIGPHTLVIALGPKYPFRNILVNRCMESKDNIPAAIIMRDYASKEQPLLSEFANLEDSPSRICEEWIKQWKFCKLVGEQGLGHKLRFPFAAYYHEEGTTPDEWPVPKIDESYKAYYKPPPP